MARRLATLRAVEWIPFQGAAGLRGDRLRLASTRGDKLPLRSMKRLRLRLRIPTTLAPRWMTRRPFDAMTAVILLLIGLVGIAATVALLVKWAPGWLAETKGLKPPESAQELGRVRTAILAMTAGAIAIVGLIYTARTFSLNRQSQITERFTRAVDQLGNQQIDIRLGGIYALERIAPIGAAGSREPGSRDGRSASRKQFAQSLAPDRLAE